MFNKLKNQAQKATEKVKDMKDNYDTEQRAKWLSEVSADKTTFKSVKEWMDMYDPKKEQKPEEAKDGESESAVKQKVLGVMAKSITKNIIKSVMEALAYADEMAANQIKNKEPKIFAFMNAVTAAFLTYRFQSKNEKKFKYIRGIAVDRIALSLIEAIDYEAKKAGKAVDQIDPKMCEQFVNQIVNMAISEIEKQKVIAIEKFKASPIFAMTGASGQDVDEGVQLIMAAAQSYGEQKLGGLIEQLKAILPVVMQSIAQHQQAIRTHLAQAANQDPSEEYINGTRAKIQDQVDGYHQKLFDFVHKFIAGFLGVLGNSSNEEAPQQ